MLECTVQEDGNFARLNPKGRIDSMTAPEIEQIVGSLILAGKRVVIADLEHVGFISSAGLRVLMMAQKQLKKVDGEVIIYRAADTVLDVFKMSGFDTIFFLAADQSDIDERFKKVPGAGAVVSKHINGIAAQYTEHDVAAGSLLPIGSQARLALSQYAESDVVTVNAADIQYGTGLAALGEAYSEFKDFFGESVVLNRSLFFYPAVKRPAVDFMLCPSAGAHIEYRFLYGFGFGGQFRYVVSFDADNGFIQLNKLIDSFFAVSSANLLGIVLLAESRGFMGMNLKQIPSRENSPANNKDIFDTDNFSSWFNFPVEPGDINNIIAGTGIAVKDKNKLPPATRELFSSDSSCHIHACVFDKGPINRNLETFENELKRIITECGAQRVQHVLGHSRFSSGIAGIIELA